MLLYTKMIILPRQARDKHRESTQNEECDLCVSAGLWTSLVVGAEYFRYAATKVTTLKITKKTPFLRCHLWYQYRKNDRFTKTGSGQT
jgi:hypothetical protein